MRYLKITRCDGIYDYVPLDNIEFHFLEVDEREYRVELSIGGHEIAVIEKLNCELDGFLSNLAFNRGFIIPLEDLIYGR